MQASRAVTSAVVAAAISATKPMAEAVVEAEWVNISKIKMKDLLAGDNLSWLKGLNVAQLRTCVEEEKAAEYIGRVDDAEGPRAWKWGKRTGGRAKVLAWLNKQITQLLP